MIKSNLSTYCFGMHVRCSGHICQFTMVSTARTNLQLGHHAVISQVVAWAAGASWSGFQRSSNGCFIFGQQVSKQHSDRQWCCIWRCQLEIALTSLQKHALKRCCTRCCLHHFVGTINDVVICDKAQPILKERSPVQSAFCVVLKFSLPMTVSYANIDGSYSKTLQRDFTTSSWQRLTCDQYTCYWQPTASIS